MVTKNVVGQTVLSTQNTGLFPRRVVRLDFDLLATLRVVKILLVLLGAVVVWLSGQAWRRNKSGAMFFLALGFGLITAGSVAAGVLFEFLGYGLLEVSITEGIVQLAGFGLIIYSIYGRPT